jgi:EAL domain-containing protein (putative c-di-GMP-specific phosphodiesterase class I)
MNPSLLTRILDDPRELSVRFQPIFHCDSGSLKVTSLEGLIRGPKGTNFERADILFDYVRRKHAEVAADRACIVAISRAVAELPCDCRINLNVHASTLGEKADFVNFFQHHMESLSLALDRVTLEIVEHAPTHNVPGLLSNIKDLRSLGVRIALDDVGLGNSNYRTILDCHPDYFKLDAFFVQGVAEDPNRRAVVRSIMCLAQDIGGSVIAEGVRTPEELSMLTQMGVMDFQANILCPAVLPCDLLARELEGLSVPTTSSSNAANATAT